MTTEDPIHKGALDQPREAVEASDEPPSYLPFDGHVEASGEGPHGGWVVRVGVRAEHVTVEKQPVVVERVLLRQRTQEETANIDETVQRERLELQAEGDVRGLDLPNAEQPLRRQRKSDR
jgi:hypothetical protein